MAKINLSIDFGSQNLKIVKNGSILFNEPCVACVSSESGKLKIKNYGIDALQNARANPHLQVVYPVSQGIVNNSNALALMLKAIITAQEGNSIIKPNYHAIVSVSCGIKNQEKKIFEEVCNKAGIKDVIIIESPLSNLMNIKTDVAFVIDIGADKTEIAIVNSSGIVVGCSIDLGGVSLDRAIVEYVSEKYNMVINQASGENIKKSIASFKNNDISSVTITGKTVMQYNANTLKLTANEIRQVICPIIDKIVLVISNVMYAIPNTYAERLVNAGFHLTGGSANIAGLADYIAKETKVKITKMEGPDMSVAIGGIKFFDDKKTLLKMLSVDKLDI